MGALDAFFMRQQAYEGLHTRQWTTFADYFTSSMRGEVDGTMKVGDFTMSADGFTRALVRTLNLAESFYVAPTMNALVTAAAESWPEDEVITADDFPVDHGYLWVPGGVSTVDMRGRLCTTVAMTWERHGGSVAITWWADKHLDPPWLKAEPYWDMQPRFTPWHMSNLSLDEALPQAFELGRVLPPEVSREVQYIDDGHGNHMLAVPPGWKPEDMQPRISVDRTSAWLVSALRIMQQPLASVTGQGLPAAVRKGLKRHPVRVKNTHVTVIDFRRRLGDFEPGSGREYSHRFLRRGHWRRQPYKREDGSWDRRRIWIHPTVVGDPSKPLILRNHVNALTR